MLRSLLEAPGIKVDSAIMTPSKPTPERIEEARAELEQLEADLTAGLEATRAMLKVLPEPLEATA